MKKAKGTVFWFEGAAGFHNNMVQSQAPYPLNSYERWEWLKGWASAKIDEENIYGER